MSDNAPATSTVMLSVLSAEERHQLLVRANYPHLQEEPRAYLVKITEELVLSKLRAPVADEDDQPTAPDDDAIAECWVTASDCYGIAYDGPSFERGYRLGEIAERDRAALASAPPAQPEKQAARVPAETMAYLRKVAASNEPGTACIISTNNLRTVLAALDQAAPPAPLASAPILPQACPTDVCQAAKADGVLCANDECDRSNGVRPASAPVAGEAVAWRVTHPRSPNPNWRDAARERPPNKHDVKQQDPDLILELAYAAPQASEAVRDALMAFDEAMSLCNDFPELQHHRDALLFAVQKARAALSAQPGAQKGGSDA